MKNKIIFLIILICFLNGCAKKMDEPKEDTKASITTGIIGNKQPIKRSTVAKMLALLNYSKDEILALEPAISFEDVNENSWYNKYINAVYIKGDMAGTEDGKFCANDPLTITQTQFLIDKYDKNKKIKINDENKDKPVSYALWCDIYEAIMEDNIEQDELVLLATAGNSSELKKDYVVTDKGLFSFEGLEYKNYINKKVKVLKKGREIVAITSVLDIEPTLKRCIIKEIFQNHINIFVGGVHKTLYYENMDITQINGLADIKINENKILKISYYNDTIFGKTNKINKKNVRINNVNYVLDDDFKVYAFDGKNFYFKNISDLLIGQDTATFFTKGNENKIYGAIIHKNPNFKNIRIAINNNGGLYFDNINLSSKNGLDIMVKGEKRALPSVNIANNSDFNIGENEIIIINSSKKNDGIKFENIKKENEIPIFFDTLEICKINGKYMLINETSLENYTKSLLASHNNNYTEKEMLKAQATIFRSYAINYILENKLHTIGVNAIDGLDYYTFNNNKIDKNVQQAVDSTKGEIITHSDLPIKATYFAYSSGTTSNSGEIWSGEPFYEYPEKNKPYLLHTKDFKENIDLTDNTNANIFFKSKDIESLEKDSEWFRWNAFIGQENINKINEKIENIYKNNKHFIKTLQNGKYIYKPIRALGKIKDINVVKRGAGGNVMTIEIIGNENSVIISTDILIKQIFDINFIKNNKNILINNVKKLPSSSFVFDKIYDDNGYLKSVNFYGGGYGHSVGLSLYGADMMAKLGKTYKDILSNYYTDINFYILQ